MKISQSAQEWVSKLIHEYPNNKGLRLKLQGGGCSGFSYKYDLIENPENDDQVIYFDDGKGFLAIDSFSSPYLALATLDFVKDLTGSKFVVHNPLAKHACGCGESFQLDLDNIDSTLKQDLSMGCHRNSSSSSD